MFRRVKDAANTMKDIAEKGACRLSACLLLDMRLKGAKVSELDVASKAKRANMKRTLQSSYFFASFHRGAWSTSNPTAMKTIREQVCFLKGVVAAGDVLIEDKLFPIHFLRALEACNGKQPFCS